MAESIWNVGDEYLKAQLLTHLGEGGDYTTLPVQAVYVWAQTDISEWINLATPFQVVMSYQSRALPAGHDGESAIKREQEYMVTVLSVVEGNAEAATQNAKILAHRVEKLLATLTYGLTSDDGSRISRPRRGSRGAMFATQIELYPRSSHTQPNHKYGVAVTQFTIPGLTT